MCSCRARLLSPHRRRYSISFIQHKKDTDTLFCYRLNNAISALLLVYDIATSSMMSSKDICTDDRAPTGQVVEKGDYELHPKSEVACGW